MPKVPQVRVTSPGAWQALLTAAVSVGVGRLALEVADQLDGQHRAAAADVADHVVLVGQRARAAARNSASTARARPARSSAFIVSMAPSAAAQATGLPP